MENKRLIFLDIDGVLNCQLHYSTSEYVQAKEDKDYHASQLCKTRIGWLNTLCEEVGASVVISSTWRSHGLEFMQKVLADNGATFDVIDVTPWLRHEGCVRGNEIMFWLKENSTNLFGVPYYDFRDYAIIDDDSDMLLWQREHFFQTDNYSGLTPNTCYRIKRFFTGLTFTPAANIS